MNKFIVVMAIPCIMGSCHELQKVAGDVLKTPGGEKPLTNSEVIAGLKEALTVGTNNSARSASKVDGFWKNDLIKIPFPPEAQKVKEKVTDLGIESQVQKFEETMNRAAEEAAKGAADIFVGAVKEMTIADGFAILKGEENAATQYLRDKTTSKLKGKFRPVVESATEKVSLTKYWNPVITTYNKIPFVEKKNPDLNGYITDRAVEGLFKLIEIEEKKIRKDPIARVTDILKRVFGSKEATTP